MVSGLHVLNQSSEETQGALDMALLDPVAFLRLMLFVSTRAEEGTSD